MAKLVAQVQTLYSQGKDENLASYVFPSVLYILLCTLAFRYLFKITTVTNNTECLHYKVFLKINIVITK